MAGNSADEKRSENSGSSSRSSVLNNLGMTSQRLQGRNVEAVEAKLAGYRKR